LLVSCATIKAEVKDPVGRVMPEPHYVLQPVGYPILVTFYYTAFEVEKDLDGTGIAVPTYLPISNQPIDLFANKTKAVTLTIEVNNPSGIEYSLSQQVDLELGKGFGKRKEVKLGGEINRSNMKYRQFNYKLPYGDDVRKVDHLLVMRISNNEVARLGDFRYNLIH
jgi:hypothetical protein